METLWLNGEYMPLAAGRLSVEDRSVLFSDGIYEVIEARRGNPLLLDDHLERWEQSAAGLRILSPYSRETRRHVISELLGKLNVQRAMIYGQLTRGAARRAHPFPANPQPTEFWFARELPARKPELYANGIKAITHPDERWTRRWIKSTSLIANVLAKQAAVEKDAYDAIMFTDDGYVTEGSTANFFAVKNGHVYTHPLNGRILSGCTRKLLLSLTRERNITIIEERFTIDFLKKVDEAFFTSTTIGVLPIASIDDAPVGDGQVGVVTGQLMEIVENELERLSAPLVSLSQEDTEEAPVPAPLDDILTSQRFVI